MNQKSTTETQKPSQNGNMYSNATTWNPFKGCHFDCTYCEPSFKRQAKRQKKNCEKCYHYTPHEHPERLKPGKVPKADIIFVAGNGDLAFANRDFISDIIDTVKETNKKYPDRIYYFQSKRPECLAPFTKDFPENAILLTTLETNRDDGYSKISKAPVPTVRHQQIRDLDYPRKVLTLEPLVDFDLEPFLQMILDVAPEYVWMGYDSKNCGLPEPSEEKVQALIDALKEHGIPVKAKILRGCIV